LAGQLGVGRHSFPQHLFPPVGLPVVYHVRHVRLGRRHRIPA